MLCIAHNRHGGGDALIAGAGDDHDRHLTAAHAGVGPGGGIGARLGADVLRAGQQRAADGRAPLARKPLLRNGGVAVDLAADHALDARKRHLIGELQNLGKVQHALVLQIVLCGGDERLVQQHLAVFLHVNDVRVVVCNAHNRPVRAARAGEPDVEHARRVLQVRGRDGRLRGVVPDGLQLRLRHVGNDLQLRILPPGDDARGHCRIDTLHSAGIRHNDAFNVLQNVAADLRQNGLRRAAERFTQHCRTVCDSDRLRTAGGEHQLFLQNRHIGVHVCFCHNSHSPYLSLIRQKMSVLRQTYYSIGVYRTQLPSRK